jgi:hypothetical protein
MKYNLCLCASNRLMSASGIPLPRADGCAHAPTRPTSALMSAAFTSQSTAPGRRFAQLASLPAHATTCTSATGPVKSP